MAIKQTTGLLVAILYAYTVRGVRILIARLQKANLGKLMTELFVSVYESNLLHSIQAF